MWRQTLLVALVAVIGSLAGANLVDLWSSQRSHLARLYEAFVVSLFSVVAVAVASYAWHISGLSRSVLLTGFWVTLAGLSLAGTLARLWPPESGNTPTLVGRVTRPSVMPGEMGVTRSNSPSDEETAVQVISARTDHEVRVLSDHPNQATCWGFDLLKSHRGSVLLLPKPYEVLLASGHILPEDGRLLLEITPRARRWPWSSVKRLVDISLSLVGLVLTLPLWVVSAVAIRLDSPGPVLFRQARVGEGGRVFNVLKFRTMVDNAESKTGAVIAAHNDLRITKVGRWLRALRLDEIPQFINVLKGDMSIIGPRPERPEFVAEFRTKIDLYDLRHLVRPGITGLAQVRGGYDMPAEEKLRFDLAYVFLWSPILDIKIILQTIAVMLTPERANSSLKTATRLPLDFREEMNLALVPDTAEVAAAQDPTKGELLRPDHGSSQ